MGTTQVLKIGEQNQIKFGKKFEIHFYVNYTLPPSCQKEISLISIGVNKIVEHLGTKSEYTGKRGECGAKTLIRYSFKAIKKGKDTICFTSQPLESKNNDNEISQIKYDIEVI